MAGEPEVSRAFSHRELRFSLPVSNPDSYIEIDGGILIKNVPLLAAGTWTDSAKQTPLDYSPEVIERHASNWIDTGIWSRHLGGVPRRITELIGEVRDPRFVKTLVRGDETIQNVMVGDVFLDLLSQESRDTAAMYKAGRARFVSVEHGGDEKWNVGRRLYEAESLVFSGLAIVKRGACEKCRLNESGTTDEADTMADTDTGKTQDFGAMIADLGAKYEEKIKALSDTVEALTATVKELAEKKPEPPAELAALDARVKMLEAAPKGTKAGGVKDDGEPRKLQVAEGIVIRSGEIYRV